MDEFSQGDEVVSTGLVEQRTRSELVRISREILESLNGLNSEIGPHFDVDLNGYRVYGMGVDHVSAREAMDLSPTGPDIAADWEARFFPGDGEKPAEVWLTCQQGDRVLAMASAESPKGPYVNLEVQSLVSPVLVTSGRVKLDLEEDASGALVVVESVNNEVVKGIAEKKFHMRAFANSHNSDITPIFIAQNI